MIYNNLVREICYLKKNNNSKENICYHVTYNSKVSRMEMSLVKLQPQDNYFKWLWLFK